MLSLPHTEGFEIIKTAVEENTREQLHLTWLIRCWDKSFTDFYRDATTPEKSEDEILSNVESILDNFKFEKVSV